MRPARSRARAARSACDGAGFAPCAGAGFATPAFPAFPAFGLGAGFFAFGFAVAGVGAGGAWVTGVCVVGMDVGIDCTTGGGKIDEVPKVSFNVVGGVAGACGGVEIGDAEGGLGRGGTTREMGGGGIFLLAKGWMGLLSGCTGVVDAKMGAESAITSPKSLQLK